MAKRRPCFEFILQVINFVFVIWGLGLLGYGLFCFIKWKQSSSNEMNHASNINKFMIVHRLLLAIDPPQHSSPWFIYLIIGIGAILLVVSCFGYFGTSSRSPCCLSSYFVFLFALLTIEVVTGAFIFFKRNWEEVVPKDRSGNFDRIYHFLNANLKVVKWVILGVIILQVIAMFLAIYLSFVFKSDWSDIIKKNKHIVCLPLARDKYKPVNNRSNGNGNDHAAKSRKQDHIPHRDAKASR